MLEYQYNFNDTLYWRERPMIDKNGEFDCQRPGVWQNAYEEECIMVHLLNFICYKDK